MKDDTELELADPNCKKRLWAQSKEWQITAFVAFHQIQYLGHAAPFFKR